VAFHSHLLKLCLPTPPEAYSQRWANLARRYPSINYCSDIITVAGIIELAFGLLPGSTITHQSYNLTMTLPAAPEAARVAFNAQGLPFSPRYEDVYRSQAGALAEARHVFLAGNDLPARWRGREQFVILETGFGLGCNFLATWLAWQRDKKRTKRLHYIALEKYQATPDELEQAHRAWLEQCHNDDATEFGALADLLRQQLPSTLLPWSGLHRLDFADERLTLTIWFGDVEMGLRDLQCSADSIYLDGFSPIKNPQMWTTTVCKSIARLAAPEATLATWCVASPVRAALAAASFDLRRTKGYGDKRHMLRGVLRSLRPPYFVVPPASDRSAIIIGAGMAGCSAAERLARRGWQVSILERASHAASGASGNLAGIFRPHPSMDDNLLARLSRSSFYALLRHLVRLSEAGHHVQHTKCGVLYLAQNPRQAMRWQSMDNSQNSPLFSWCPPQETPTLSIRYGAIYFPDAGWLNPASLCRANLALASAHARRHGQDFACAYGKDVDHITRQDNLWLASDSSGQTLDSAQHLIIAGGAEASRFTQLGYMPLRVARGQVTHLPPCESMAHVEHVICGGGYLTPLISSDNAYPVRLLGASHVVDDWDTSLRASEQRENLSLLTKLLPGVDLPLTSELSGRVSLRPMSPDKMPIVGAVADFTNSSTGPYSQVALQQGLWCLLGYGSRGIVWSHQMAETLACLMEGSPPPLGRRLLRSISPARFNRSGA